MSTVLHDAKENAVFVGESTLVVMTCPACGVTYAIPLRLQEEARSKGHGLLGWYCPTGHRLGYYGRSDAERARRSRKRERRRARDVRDERNESEPRLLSRETNQ